MARKENTGIRKPMSEETRKKIAQAVKQKAKVKRIEAGLPPDAVIPLVPSRGRELELVQMKDQQFDPALFIPMPTNSPIDFLFTVEGGLPKATNYMVVGDPGVGKSTVALDIVADLIKTGHKCLFISAEMTRIDLYKYVQRYPKFGNIDILFLGEYIDDNPKLVIEEALEAGYDLVLIDSFVEVQEAVREVNRITTNSAEKWLIDLMLRNNLGNNTAQKNTTFLAIQQVTKGGIFVGSNKLKHNTTGMMELRFDDEDPSLSHIYFSKNRRGPVNHKIYFSVKEGQSVRYSSQAFPQEEEQEPFDILIQHENRESNPFSV